MYMWPGVWNKALWNCCPFVHIKRGKTTKPQLTGLRRKANLRKEMTQQ